MMDRELRDGDWLLEVVTSGVNSCSVPGGWWYILGQMSNHSSGRKLQNEW